MVVQINLSPIKIETKHLIIQPFIKGDFENSVILYGDAEITKYFDFGLPRSRDEVKDMVEHYNIFFSKTGYLGLFSVFEKSTMDFVGHIDCVPTDTIGILEIGFIINKHYQRRRLAGEMLKAFIYNFLLDIKDKLIKYQARGLMATVHPENKASIRLLESVGMKFEHSLTRFNQLRLKYFLPI
jgi:ribosomal-protein-alanine N-acetyltransferase